MRTHLKNLLEKIPTGTLSGVTLAGILWLTLAPHPTGDVKVYLFPGFDKFAHGVMYGVLTFIVLLEWMKKRKWVPISMAGMAVVPFACALLGVVLEYAQHVMGLGRTWEIYDMLANASGAMIGGGIWALIQDRLTGGS